MNNNTLQEQLLRKYHTADYSHINTSYQSVIFDSNPCNNSNFLHFHTPYTTKNTPTFSMAIQTNSLDYYDEIENVKTSQHILSNLHQYPAITTNNNRLHETDAPQNQMFTETKNEQVWSLNSYGISKQKFYSGNNKIIRNVNAN